MTDAWRRRGDALIRDFRFRDFPAALAFVDVVAAQGARASAKADSSIRNASRSRGRAAK